jgi:uncharacterized protein
VEDRVYFRDKEGTKLVGLLNERSRNIVILLHGFRDSKNGSSVKRLAEDLLEQNVSSFRFDMFAHGESEGKFEDLTVTKAVSGALSAIGMLKEMGFQKMGVMGVSFGGIVALVTAYKTKEVKYLALKSPVSDYVYLKEKREGKAKVLQDGSFEITTRKGVTYKLNKCFYEDGLANSPYKFAKELDVPVLIVHGDEDSLVPLEQSQKLIELLPKVRLEVIEGCDHWYNGGYFEQSIHLLEEFILKQNGI